MAVRAPRRRPAAAGTPTPRQAGAGRGPPCRRRQGVRDRPVEDGTTSLYVALAELGLRSVTFRHLRRRGLHDWWDGDFGYDYLGGIDAATDLPIGHFFRELDVRYPGSKFVLTVRDEDSWAQSLSR